MLSQSRQLPPEALSTLSEIKELQAQIRRITDIQAAHVLDRVSLLITGRKDGHTVHAMLTTTNFTAIPIELLRPFLQTYRATLETRLFLANERQAGKSQNNNFEGVKE